MQPGTQLAHYEILSAIGKGGMGEVWRARDTKLGREVAIKTLPPEFAQDEERLARFEREAKLLASLNHPNIAAIYGLEEHEGSRFLVLELVEGDTLAEVLKRGPLPVEESLKLALQIAEALEAAHEKGVVHRDLKPANIKVTPDGKVKVLDFGLAKAFAGDQSDANLSNSPTLSMQATQQGVILGTAAYMSPEQAKGLPADHRADVFAFGCVLFEMLTGRMAFRGELVSEILASVITQEPDYDLLQENLHPRIKELLRRCFEKQPRDRWQAVGDIRAEIERVPRPFVEQRTVTGRTMLSRRSVLGWAGGATGLAGVAFAAGWGLRPAPSPRSSPVRRFEILPPDNAPLVAGTPGSPDMTISPDGMHVVYKTVDDGLMLWQLNELEPRPLVNPVARGGGYGLFFSPDGSNLALGASNGLMQTMPFQGGNRTPVATVEGNFRGGDWTPGGEIIFASQQSNGLLRVSAAGGDPQPLTEAVGESFHYFPCVLPDGNAVIYTVLTNSNDLTTARIVARILDSGNEADEVPVLEGASDARYVASGHLVFVGLDRNLWAVAFDPNTLSVISDRRPIPENVEGKTFGTSANWAVSDEGTLVYLRDVYESPLQLRDLVIVDQESESGQAITPDSAPWDCPRSFDGRFVVVWNGADNSIWRIDLQTGSSPFQIVRGGRYPLWTPDGNSIVFDSGLGDEGRVLSVQNSDGTGSAQQVVEAASAGSLVPVGWTENRGLIFEYRDPEVAELGFGLLPSIEGNDSWRPLLSGSQGAVSPDGRRLAFVENERVISVRLSDLGDRQSVSRGQGFFPAWAENGDVYYVEPEGEVGKLVRAIASREGDSVRFGDWRDVLPSRPIPRLDPSGGMLSRTYDVLPDGRVIVLTLADVTAASVPQPRKLTVVTNWFEELKARVPVP